MGSSRKRSRSLGTRTARSAPCSIVTRRCSVAHHRHSSSMRHVEEEAGASASFKRRRCSTHAYVASAPPAGHALVLTPRRADGSMLRFLCTPWNPQPQVKRPPTSTRPACALTGEETSTAMLLASSSPKASSKAALKPRTKLSRSSDDGDPNLSSGCKQDARTAAAIA